MKVFLLVVLMLSIIGLLMGILIKRYEYIDSKVGDLTITISVGILFICCLIIGANKVF